MRIAQSPAIVTVPRFRSGPRRPFGSPLGRRGLSGCPRNQQSRGSSVARVAARAEPLATDTRRERCRGRTGALCRGSRRPGAAPPPGGASEVPAGRGPGPPAARDFSAHGAYRTGCSRHELHEATSAHGCMRVVVILGNRKYFRARTTGTRLGRVGVRRRDRGTPPGRDSRCFLPAYEFEIDRGCLRSVVCSIRLSSLSPARDFVAHHRRPGFCRPPGQLPLHRP